MMDLEDCGRMLEGVEGVLEMMAVSGDAVGDTSAVCELMAMCVEVVQHSIDEAATEAL